MPPRGILESQLRPLALRIPRLWTSSCRLMKQERDWGYHSGQWWGFPGHSEHSASLGLVGVSEAEHLHLGSQLQPSGKTWSGCSVPLLATKSSFVIPTWKACKVHSLNIFLPLELQPQG